MIPGIGHKFQAKEEDNGTRWVRRDLGEGGAFCRCAQNLNVPRHDLVVQWCTDGETWKAGGASGQSSHH